MRGSVTRAAEGFDRRAFTVDEVLRMQEAGIISEDENFELIEGEIVPMQAKTHAHELLKSALNIAVVRALPDRLWVGVETTIYLTPNTFVEPDLVVYPRGLKLETVKGSDIELAIEVAQAKKKPHAAECDHVRVKGTAVVHGPSNPQKRWHDDFSAVRRRLLSSGEITFRHLPGSLSK